MKPEPNNKKHLTPRQIINRYRKGIYVDENIEVISSVISSCDQTFNSIAIAFPITLVEKIMENLNTLEQLYERQAAGQSTEDIVIEDYPHLKDILWDLSYPPLWESMKSDKKDPELLDILKKRGLIHKYQNLNDLSSSAIGCITTLYSDSIKKADLSSTTLQVALHFML